MSSSCVTNKALNGDHFVNLTPGFSYLLFTHSMLKSFIRQGLAVKSFLFSLLFWRKIPPRQIFQYLYICFKRTFFKLLLPIILDQHSMIEKITNNTFNTEELNLNSTDKIKEKLDFYRSLFGKTHDLNANEFENLKKDIATFFTLKPGIYTEDAPKQLVRISNNNRILKAQGKELSYLTDISQLLAPPTKYCNFGRCNIPNYQVLYCSMNEAGAYWETRPKKGDVITLSHFELKQDAKVICHVIKKEKTKNQIISNQLQQVYYLLEEFFVDVFSILVNRDRPGDYLFSGILSSEMLFYPIVSDLNYEAIIYPSVQKKKYDENFAIRNDLILKRYNLIGVETRFVLDEYENLDPASEEVTTDQIISSFGTNVFDFNSGKILYNEEEANKAFKLFRELQTGTGKQTRFEHEGIPKNILFNLSAKKPIYSLNIKKEKIGRNDRVNVIHQNGVRTDNVKYKYVKDDIEQRKCRVIKY